MVVNPSAAEREPVSAAAAPPAAGTASATEQLPPTTAPSSTSEEADVVTVTVAVKKSEVAASDLANNNSNDDTNDNKVTAGDTPIPGRNTNAPLFVPGGGLPIQQPPQLVTASSVGTAYPPAALFVPASGPATTPGGNTFYYCFQNADGTCYFYPPAPPPPILQQNPIPAFSDSSEHKQGKEDIVPETDQKKDETGSSSKPVSEADTVIEPSNCENSNNDNSSLEATAEVGNVSKDSLLSEEGSSGAPSADSSLVSGEERKSLEEGKDRMAAAATLDFIHLPPPAFVPRGNESHCDPHHDQDAQNSSDDGNFGIHEATAPPPPATVFYDGAGGVVPPPLTPAHAQQAHLSETAAAGAPGPPFGAATTAGGGDLLVAAHHPHAHLPAHAQPPPLPHPHHPPPFAAAVSFMSDGTMVGPMGEIMMMAPPPPFPPQQHSHPHPPPPPPPPQAGGATDQGQAVFLVDAGVQDIPPPGILSPPPNDFVGNNDNELMI